MKISYIREEVAEVARDLVRIRSYSTEERKAAKYVYDYLQSNGIAASIDENFNVVASVGNSERYPTLLLNGHLDTVPVSDPSAWRYDPFGADMAEGNIYGRGSVDMKGGIAAMLVALKHFSKTARSSILFTAVACEEATDNADRYRGTVNLLERNVCSHARAAIIAEPTNGRISTGHRGRGIMRISVLGKSAHVAIAEEGVNSVYHLVKLLNELTAEVDAYFHKEERTSQSFTLGPISGGKSANVVPDFAEVVFESRFEFEDHYQQVYGIIERVVNAYAKRQICQGVQGLKIKVEEIGTRHAVASEGQEDSAFAELAVRAIGAEGLCIRSPFSTDAGYIKHALAIPVLIYGPGDERLCHQVDEHVSLDSLERTAKGFLNLLEAFFASV